MYSNAWGESETNCIFGLNNFSSSFIQVSGNGEKVSGLLYVKRPNVKWVYRYPSGTVDLLFDGKLLSYYDKDLGEVNNYFVSGGILSVFSSEGDLIDKSEDLDVQKISGDRILIEGNDADSGVHFSFYFSGKCVPLKLDVTDYNDEVTSVSFFNVNNNTSIEAGTFVLNKNDDFNADF